MLVEQWGLDKTNQDRRQDLPAGGHIFKKQYWMYATTGGPNVKWGGREPLPPPAGDDPETNTKCG